MNQGGDDVGSCIKAGGLEHGSVFGGTVGAAFGEHEKMGAIKRDWQRAIKGIVQENIVDEQARSRGHGGRATAKELLTLGDVPIVKDVGEQVNIGSREGIAPHVMRLKVEAVGDAVSLGEFSRNFQDFRTVKHRGAKMWIFLEAGDGVNATTTADIKQVLGVREWNSGRQGRGDIFGAARQGECEMAGGRFCLHGGGQVFAENESGTCFILLQASGPIGAETFDHGENAGILGGEAEITADIKIGGFTQVFESDWGRYKRPFMSVGESYAISGKQKAKSTQARDQNSGGAEFKSELFTQGCEGERTGLELFEHAEMGDGSGKKLRAKHAAINLEDGTGVVLRWIEGGKLWHGPIPAM
ncbi:hypothetical protein Cflav_PD0585 [Pedosphaera parvula Ellin514]|uniref:Uncharacterized protein n=1 Tax=Pedosphaera parvula (strain Ellin514) TaxID=320771 RepID=B9XS32_PEDPL|nr:hypothetical protein Cflav_PD0585 [Pedosphaera parvula Ellin514]